MIKRTQSLPLNTIILIIIAIAVLVFLIGGFIPQTLQPTPPPYPNPSPNQIISAQCSEYAAVIANQMATSNDSSVQLRMLANSQYVSSNCSTSSQYSFTLYNGSEVVCGLGSSYCIVLSGSKSCSSCQPPDCIPGCELE